MSKYERTGETNEDQLEIRTDSTPITRRLPNFPDTKELYWISKYLGEEEIGPSQLEVVAWGKFDEEIFFDFIQEVPTVQDASFIPSFTPKQIDYEYNWEKMDMTYVAKHQLFGDSFEASKLYVVGLDVYIDREHFVMYIRVVTET